MKTPPIPAPTPPPAEPESAWPGGGTEAAEIFATALDLPVEERDRFIAKTCGADEVMRTEVQALLLSHEGAGSFMREAVPLAPELERQQARLLPEREGERIGRYKLLQEIGEGGFGTVWMAEQLEPVSRRVALKIIKLGMDTREVIARFESERQALALMEHQHIAKVFDAGATPLGRPYFVMELVRGIPITDYCDAAGLGTRERLALFGDVCSAISHAHQKGVIHRDIKPSNVMITLHGDKPVVKVIDFGIAKATQGRLTDKTLFTRFEQFMGTPAYMSPEQANWSGLDVDTRSDIYALGVLLYELLTGQPPFDARKMATAGYDEIRRIISEVEPPKPSARLRTPAGEERARLAKARPTQPENVQRLVEPDLDWIVMKALEKDRSRRYQTVNGLAQDLTHFLADEPVSARPPSRAYLFRKFARRHQVALRVGAGIAALLVAATAVSAWQAVRARRAEAGAQVEAARAQEQRLRADAESERAQQQLYDAHMHLGGQAWREHRGLKALRAFLARWVPTAGEPDRRGWEWHYLLSLPEQNLRTLSPSGNGGRPKPSSLAWHAGSQRLAEGTSTGEIRIWDVERATVTRTLPGSVPEMEFWGGRWLAWNPAGSLLAAGGRDGTVRIWEIDGDREPRVLRARVGSLRAVAFSSDGRRVAAWGTGGLVTIWETQTGRVSAEIVHPAEVTASAWSPDDRTLAAGHANGTVTFSSTETGAPIVTLPAHSDLIYDLVWSPDGTRIATSSANDFFVNVWEVASLRKVLGPLRHSHGIATLAWEPEGRRLASGSIDETVKIWDTASGRELVTLRGVDGSATALAWGPGGQFAVGEGSGGMKVWASLRDQEWSILPGRGRRSTAVAWSPKDSRLASAGDDGKVRLWQPAAGQEELAIPAHDEGGIFPQFGLVRSLAWSPDGRRVASAGLDGAAKVWDAETGGEVFALPGGHGAYWCVAWSPDGAALAAGAQDGTIQLAEGFPRLPKIRAILAHESAASDKDPREGVRALAWSPRGDRLASGGWDTLVKIWDQAKGVEVQRLSGHRRAILSVAWSPDGQQLATASGDFFILLWDAATGRQRQTLRGHNDYVDAVRWSPDGSRLASAGIDNSVRIWNPRTGQETFVLRGNSGMFHDVSWSADGRQLAAASSDGDVWIWDASLGFAAKAAPTVER